MGVTQGWAAAKTPTLYISSAIPWCNASPPLHIIPSLRHNSRASKTLRPWTRPTAAGLYGIVYCAGLHVADWQTRVNGVLGAFKKILHSQPQTTPSVGRH